MSQNGTRLNDVNDSASEQRGRVASGSGSNEAVKVVIKRNPHGRRRKKILRMATWNVRSLYQPGKLDNVINEMDRMKINIMGLAETRWTEAGKVAKENGHVLVYSGGERHEYGVGILMDKHTSAGLKCYVPISDRVIMIKLAGKPFDLNVIQVYMPTTSHEEEEIDVVYEDIENLLAQTKTNEISIILGDMNAKVGRGKEGTEVGPWGLGIRNERGHRLVQFCRENSLCIANTYFEKHPRHLYTWQGPAEIDSQLKIRNQIDYILVQKRFKNGVENVKTYPGADCYSDHNPVVMDFRIKLKKLERPKKAAGLNLSQLSSCKNKCTEYNAKVTEKLLNLKRDDDEESEMEIIDKQWENIKRVLSDTANEIVDRRKKSNKSSWMTNEILELMEQRRKLKRNTAEYKALHRVIGKKCIQAKETWMNSECVEVEKLIERHAHKAVHQKVKEITCFKKSSVSAGIIRDKEGKLCYERDDVMKRWVEYLRELFDDEDRPEEISGDITVDEEEDPPILMCELESAMKEMRKGKAAGPDGVVIEMMQHSGQAGKETLLTLFNRIYRTGHLPEDFVRSVFISLPKKPKASECKDHRTISLMAHAVKLLLKIVERRIRMKLETEIANIQFGYRKGSGTREGIFTLRTICERMIEVQQDVYLCFVDYEKAFDKVQHHKLLDMLKKHHIGKNNLQLITNLYWKQEAAMRVEGELSGWTSIKRGVRQGCILSPRLFNFYSEMIMREAAIENLGITIGGLKISNIRYADDTVLMATSEEELQQILDKVRRSSEEHGLRLNVKKTKSMVVSKTPKRMLPSGAVHYKQTQLKINDEVVENVDHFCYLGSEINNDARCDREVRSRIAQAKTQFVKLRRFLSNSKIGVPTRKRMITCYVWSVLLYGVEAWTLNKGLEKRLEAFEMWCWRRMLNISWKRKLSNVQVLKRASETRRLLNIVKRRKTEYFGHILRHNELLCATVEGKISGKKARGRQRRTYTDDIKEWTGTRTKEDAIRKAMMRRLKVTK